jgi:hypothetical protein
MCPRAQPHRHRAFPGRAAAPATAHQQQIMSTAAHDCLSELVRVVKYLQGGLAPWTPCLI